MKKVPSFWWDFNMPRLMPIIVECDDPKHPLVAVFDGDVTEAMERATELIEDLRAGRADYRRLAQRYELTLWGS